MSDDGQNPTRAALVILVPEMELLVGAFRLKYDPTAADGMPAHITINYPFLPGIDPEDDLYQKLTDLFSKIEPFTITFGRSARFPGVLYLAPDPDTPLRQLIKMVAACFPESPPYGGALDSIVPHLTVAYAEDKALESVERQLAALSREHLPLSVRVELVWLMDNRTGRWQKRKAFQLSTR
jgi:2'-5' RNA ligase